MKEIFKEATREEPPFWPSVAEGRDTLGKVFTLCFGPFPRMQCLDPIYLQDIFGRKSKFYRKSSIYFDILSPLIGNGLVVSEGTHWKRQRHVINPAFTGANVFKMVPLLVAK